MTGKRAHSSKINACICQAAFASYLSPCIWFLILSILSHDSRSFATANLSVVCHHSKYGLRLRHLSELAVAKRERTMWFPVYRLAITASVVATASALLPQDIPTDLPVSSLLSTAQTLLARGETNEAIIYYDTAIARDPNNYLTLFKRATAFLSLGRSNQATDDFNKVLALKPGFHGAHVQLAKIKSKTADWDGARADYVAAEKPEDSPELIELAAAEAAAIAAVAAVKDKNWDACVSNAGTAIVIASRSLALRQMRSICRFERGEIEEGMGDLQHVLHMRPGDTSPHVVISATSFYALGDLNNGLSQIRKCLHSDPDSKLCKRLHKQEKALEKGINRAVGQLNKGQTTTAGRTLVGTEDEPGLIKLVQEQTEELRKTGSIPEKAPFKLYERLIDMTCQAYSEVQNSFTFPCSIATNCATISGDTQERRQIL